MAKTRYKRKPFKPINRDDFKELRLMNRLTINETAKLLHVTARTVSSWESGSARIPYSAFKLFRCLANGEIVSQSWNGWRIKDDALWSPSGRSFRVHELLYLSHYFTMARYWLQERNLNPSRASALKNDTLRPLKLIIGGLKP